MDDSRRSRSRLAGNIDSLMAGNIYSMAAIRSSMARSSGLGIQCRCDTRAEKFGRRVLQRCPGQIL